MNLSQDLDKPPHSTSGYRVKFLSLDRSIFLKIMLDGLHLNERDYQILDDAVAPRVSFLLKDKIIDNFTEET